MTGLWLLVGARLRRDRALLIIWALGVAALWAGSTAGVDAALDDEGRSGLVALLAANPALLMLRGAPAGTSIGAVISVSVLAYVCVMIALMQTFLAVRHGRAEEDAGRTELVLGTAVGRAAPPAATVVAGVIELCVVCVALGASSMVVGLDPGASWMTALAAGLVGATFLLVGVLASQAMPTSRSANGAAAALVGAAFVVRGIGDAMGEASADLTGVEPAWATWASPIGWATLSRPFATGGWDPQPQSLWLFAPLLVVLAALAVAVEMRRELGASLVPERGGRPAARRLGALVAGAPIMLAVRLQRGATIGWLAGAVVVGLLVGRLAPQLATAIDDDEQLGALVERLGGSFDDSVLTFVSALAGIVSIVACACAMQGMVRLRHEEVERGEMVLATRVSRSGWMVSSLVVALVSGVLVLVIFGVVTGVGLQANGEPHWGDVAQIVGSMLPLVAVYVAIGALLVGLLPATVTWLGWLLLVGLMLVGEFVPLFGDDWAWLANASPFHWVADPLSDAPDWAPTWWMLAASALAIAVALVAFRRRDAVR